MSYINIFAQAPAAAEAAAATTPAPAQAQAGTVQPSDSKAATSTAQQDVSSWGTFIPIILLIVIFYFLAIRPQQKQQKELKARQEALKAGDEIITAGGIYGTVRYVEDHSVKLEIASGTIIKIEKTSIVRTLGKNNK